MPTQWGGHHQTVKARPRQAKPKRPSVRALTRQAQGVQRRATGQAKVLRKVYGPGPKPPKSLGQAGKRLQRGERLARAGDTHHNEVRYAKHLLKLYRKAHRAYPELKHLPTLHVDSPLEGGLLFSEKVPISWVKHGEKGGWHTTPAVLKMFGKKDYAASVPLHEWEHVAQNVRGDRTPDWRKEVGAERKEIKVAPTVGLRSSTNPKYRHYLIVTHFPKAAREMDRQAKAFKQQTPAIRSSGFKYRYSGTPRLRGTFGYKLRHHRGSDIRLGA